MPVCLHYMHRFKCCCYCCGLQVIIAINRGPKPGCSRRKDAANPDEEEEGGGDCNNEIVIR